MSSHDDDRGSPSSARRVPSPDAPSERALPTSEPLLLVRSTNRPPPPPVAQSPLRRFVTRSARVRFGRAGALVVALFAMVAIFADFLASDLPLLGDVGGHVWILPNVTRPADLTRLEVEERARETRWAIPPLVQHGPQSVDTSPDAALRPPFAVKGHPFGTDARGHDVFARVVHGTRSYLLFAVAAVALSMLLGGLAGGTAGLYGGPLDVFVGRVIETISAFPSLVLILGVQAAVPRANLVTLFFAIALTRFPEVARLVRAEVIGVATREYVTAARALGASPWRVLRRHVGPNVRGQLVVMAGFGVPAVLLIEASLDFLRVGGGVVESAGPIEAGVAPLALRAASWGETMSQFRDAPHAWWLLAGPGIPLFLLVVALNLAAEARREQLDPRA